MTTTTTTPLDLAQVSQLAAQMYGLLTPFTSANEDNVAAREASDAAKEGETNARETVMLSLAAFSQAHQLSANDAARIAAKCASAHNNGSTQKALDTFIGECKSALHPNARAHVASLAALRSLCWDSEKFAKDADKEAPTPLRATFKRQYHMLLALLREAVAGNVLDTAEDVKDWADKVAEEQRTKIPAVLKKLEKLTAELRAFHADFPVDDIQVAIDTLADVDAKALKMARAQITAAAAGNVVAMPKAAPVAPPVAEVIPTVVDESESPVDGAYDLEADLLGETAELVAA